MPQRHRHFIDLMGVGVGDAGIGAAVHNVIGHLPGQIALRTARFKPVRSAENVAEAGGTGELGVAAAAGGAHDALRAVLRPDVHQLAGNDVDGLIPADALPFVLAPLADPDQGILVAVGIVERLNAGETLGAHTPLAHPVFRVTLQFDDPAVLHRGDDAAVGNAGAAGGAKLDDLVAPLRRLRRRT